MVMIHFHVNLFLVVPDTLWSHYMNIYIHFIEKKKSPCKRSTKIILKRYFKLFETAKIKVVN